MKPELPGVLQSNGIWVKANSLSQGEQKIVIPCMWRQDENHLFREAVIFFYVVPTNDHAFTFFKNGITGTGTILADIYVSFALGLRFYSTPGIQIPLKGQTDYVTVRHSTQAQDSNEMAAPHIDEGFAIWAGLIP